ncbi:MAG: tetratricopeptide repeat protein, partial [Alistipes sp.]|nr:tetratricopeptide repeat protein [Alistipes sp.]
RVPHLRGGEVAHRGVGEIGHPVAEPEHPEILLERGRWYYRRNEWGKALNDFNRAAEIAPDCTEARQMREMIYEILQFRYTDIYNP